MFGLLPSLIFCLSINFDKENIKLLEDLEQSSTTEEATSTTEEATSTTEESTSTTEEATSTTEEATTTDQALTKGNSLSTGAIVGIVLGCIVVIVLLITIIVLHLKKRTKSNEQLEDNLNVEV